MTAGCMGIVAKGGMEVYTPGVYGDVLRSCMLLVWRTQHDVVDGFFVQDSGSDAE